MKKATVIRILAGLLVSLLAWGGSSILTNSGSIIRLQERDMNTQSLLMEVRKDVKTLLIRSSNN